MSKPRIVVSRCLGYEACRYNGAIISVSWHDKLEEMAEVIAFCPEVEAGLGTPRKPINLFKEEGNVRVVQDDTGIDLTDQLEKVSEDFLSTIGNVDGFVLKTKSPSCGIDTTKIRYDDSLYLTSGVFAKKAMTILPDAVFVDETKLEKDGVEAFIKSLYTWLRLYMPFSIAI